MIDKKELKNVDNFSIWKIESGILLKKYEMHIVKGKMMHKPVKVVWYYENKIVFGHGNLFVPRSYYSHFPVCLLVPFTFGRKYSLWHESILAWM